MGVGLGALRVLVHFNKNYYQGEEGWCARFWMQHIPVGPRDAVGVGVG